MNLNNQENIKNERRRNYNTYYIFQESSANPSGFYRVNPYLERNRIIVSDNNPHNNSSAVEINSQGLY